MKAAVPLVQTGAFFPNSPAPRSEILGSAFYNDFLRRHSRVVDAAGLCVVHEPPLSTMLSCNRAASKRDYGPKEHALIRALGPHLQRAVSIHRRLGRVEIESASSSFVLDRLACGVVFVDERGKAMLFNRAAREILDDNDGLALSAEGELSASRPAERSALCRLIRAACETGNGSVEESGGALQLSRPSHERPYAVIVSPLRLREWAIFRSRPAGVVFVTDPDRAPAPLAEHLVKLFGLTPSEARLTASLSAG